MSDPSDFLKKPFEKRRAEADRIRVKYPDRVPVICKKYDKSDLPDIDKAKYLVPKDLTVGQFVSVIRKRLKLSPEKSLYLFANGLLPNNGASLHTVYQEYKGDDGFLYLSYSGEDTFGGNGATVQEVATI